MLDKEKRNKLLTKALIVGSVATLGVPYSSLRGAVSANLDSAINTAQALWVLH